MVRQWSELLPVTSRGMMHLLNFAVEDGQTVVRASSGYIRTITAKLIANSVFRTTFRGNCHTLDLTLVQKAAQPDGITSRFFLLFRFVSLSKIKRRKES